MENAYRVQTKASEKRERQREKETEQNEIEATLRDKQNTMGKLRILIFNVAIYAQLFWQTQ